MTQTTVGIVAIFLIAIVILILAFWRVITGAEDEIERLKEQYQKRTAEMLDLALQVARYKLKEPKRGRNGRFVSK